MNHVHSINEVMKTLYEPALTNQLYNSHHHHPIPGIDLGIYLSKKEQPMTTLEKIREERKEARERERINFLYQAYDNLDLDDRPDGTVVRFMWTVVDRDITRNYTYAAIWVAGGWYVTGRESPNGLGVEDFVAWLISKDIPAADLEWMEVP